MLLSSVFLFLTLIASTYGISYELIVTIDEHSLSALQQDGYRLYLFKGVSASSVALSTVWMKQDLDSTSLRFAWEDEFKGYITSHDAKPGAIIDHFDSQPSEETAEITSKAYNEINVDASTGGDHRIYYLQNKSKQPMTGGLMLKQNEVELPICVMSLPTDDEANKHDMETNYVEIVPLHRVFLIFSTADYHVGEVISQVTSPGLLVDMSVHTHISINYDHSIGWDDADSIYAVYIPPTQLFQSFLNMLSSD
jgi:hypothetical protein